MLIAHQQCQGVKLFSIKPSSSWAQLGLLNGDVIRTIGGKPLCEGTPLGSDWSSAISSSMLDRSTGQIHVGAHEQLVVARRGGTITLNP